MADDNKLNARVGNQYKGIFSSLEIAPIKLASQDIDNWRKAVNSARDKYFPRRRMLYELYDNVGLDGKVVTVEQKSTSAITNKDFTFAKDGKPIQRIIEEVIEAEFWDHLLESFQKWEQYYGHLALEIVPGSDRIIDCIEVLPVANIVPETGLIIPNYMDTQNGILFRGPNADPYCKKYVLEFGARKNYGLMMSIAQYVIYKRGGFGDWAQFAELFGMPFRVGKYNPLDPKSRKLLSDGLREIGGSGFAVIPEGTSLDFQQSNYGSGQSGIFKDLIKECDDQIAQIALGGTMTTTNGSSKAQGEVHKEGEVELSKSRLKKILKFLNGPFRMRLIDLGYKEAADGRFSVDSTEVIPLKDRITIDMQVSQKVKIDPKHWYDTYGVPAPPSGPEEVVQEEKGKGNDNGDEGKKETEKKKTKLSVKLGAYYTQHCCKKCGGLKAQHDSGIKLSASSDSEIDRLAKLIFDGKLKNGKLDKKLLRRTAKTLMDGITSGYVRKPGSESFNVADETMIAMMKENVFVFSGFKTYQQLKEASALLLDSDGQVKTFSDFKNDLLKLDSTYNVTYAAPEYDLAVASSQMASKWVGFDQLGPDFGNWKYMTAGDERVRELHALLNGKVFKRGDPKTDNLFPPNGWRCRCDGDATDEPVSEGPVNVRLSGMWDNNVGKTGIVFPKNHPYYSVSKNTADRITKFSKDQIGK